MSSVKKTSRKQFIENLLKDLSDEEFTEDDIKEITGNIKNKKLKKDKKSVEIQNLNDMQEEKVVSQNKEKICLNEQFKSINISDENLEDDQIKFINDDQYLEIEDVDGDGNCLWYAICTALLGNTKYYFQLKTYFLFMTVMQFDSLQDYIIENNAQQYYSEYIQDRVWGNIDHVGEVISNSLGRSILLYTNENLKNGYYMAYGKQNNKKKPLSIYYNGVNHYKAVVIKNKHTKQQEEIDERPFSFLLQELIENFFEDRNFFKYNKDYQTKIEENPQFYQDLSFNSKCYDSVIETLEDFFDIDLEYNMKSLTFDFNCCTYEQTYASYKKDCYSYDEKFIHLKSVSSSKKLCQYYYPQKICDIKSNKQKYKKQQRFRKSLEKYCIKRCSHCQNQRLALVKKDNNQNKTFWFIPYQNQVEDILSLIHSSVHRKRDQMLTLISRLQIHIPNCKNIINDFIQSCKQCSQEPDKKKRPASKQIVSSEPLERIQMDCMELHSKLQQKGYVQLLNIKDHFSRFSKSQPIKNKKAETIADCLQDFFINQGVPQILHTDNGLEFNNQTIKSLCDTYNVEYIKGRPYHPQSQGSIEIFNKWIHRRLIMMFQNEEEFDLRKSLYQLVFDYNNTQSRVTKFKPIEAIKLSPKNDIENDKIKLLIHNVQSSQPKCKNSLDFKIGDKALLSNQVTNSPGKNLIIKKPTLKSKSGELKLYYIAVTISKVTPINVCIRIDCENENNLYKGQDYLCSVQYLKLITEDCWQKFIKREIDEEEIIEMIDTKESLNDDSELDSSENFNQELDDKDQNDDENNDHQENSDDYDSNESENSF